MTGDNQRNLAITTVDNTNPSPDGVFLRSVRAGILLGMIQILRGVT